MCCLSAVNLAKFVHNPFTDEAWFDTEEFVKTVGTGIRFLDNVLTQTEYPIPEVEEQAMKYRRIGLGITGLGDMLAMMGMKYGSEKAVDFVGGVMAVFRDTSYSTSSLLARDKGAFPGYKDDYLYGGFVSQLPKWLQEDIATTGMRNAYVGTVAPTGTTSLSLGNNCSSGVEPIFALKYNRSYRIGDDIDEKATETVYNNAYLEFIEAHGEDAVIPASFVTSNDLTVTDHIAMQSVVQKYIDQSVSKTITLPSGSSKEDMKHVYYEAWEKGLKGCTVFNPDGKLASVIFTDEKKTTEAISERPKVLPADVREFTHKGQRYHALIGIVPETEKPYEIFVVQQSEENYRKWVGDFSVIREKSDHYALYYNGECIIEDISENFGFADEAPFSCLSVSYMLQAGIPVEKVVKVLNKRTLITSFPKALGRVLKHYVVETDTKHHCPECDGVMNMVEGCMVCPDCGHGACG